MSLKKVTEIDLIEVIANNTVQVRKKISIVENNTEIGASFHRHVIRPGDDYTNEDSRVYAICSVLHTPEVVAEFQANQIKPGV